jgi:hypothetical protein
MADDGELDSELASRFAVTAVAADLEYWAGNAAVVDVFRDASPLEPSRSRPSDAAAW